MNWRKRDAELEPVAPLGLCVPRHLRQLLDDLQKLRSDRVLLAKSENAMYKHQPLYDRRVEDAREFVDFRSLDKTHFGSIQPTV